MMNVHSLNLLRKTTLILFLLVAEQSGAVTFNVDSPADLPDGDLTDDICSWMANPDADIPTCTLRAAVMQANAIGIDESPDVDIQLTPGENYLLSGLGMENDMIGMEGDLDIARSMTIGVDSMFEQAQITGVDGAERIFTFLPGASGSIVRGVKLTNAASPYSGCVAEAKDNAGAVTFEHVEIFDTQCGGNGALWFKNEQSTIRGSVFHHNERSVRGSFNVLTIENSTFHDHSQLPAIYLYSSNITVISSTFSDNRVSVSGNQTNIFVQSSTFASGEASHIYFESAGNNNILNIRNSLFVDSAVASCEFESGPGTVDVTGSVFDDESCIPNNNVPAVPNLYNAFISLAVLGDFGGPTPTREPLPGSDGIDHIPPAECAANDVDQRGSPRAVSYYGEMPARCDAGSVELNPLAADAFLFSDGFESN